MKKQLLIELSIYIFVFIILLIIATFYDYQISTFFAAKYLKNGNYYSKNIFANVIEIVGESILYILLTFAFSILALYFYDKKKYFKILTIVFFLVAIYFSYRLFATYGKYIADIYNVNFFKTKWFEIIYLLLSLIYFAFDLLFIIKKYQNKIKEILPFAIIIIATFAISTIITQLLIKPYIGRERFRTTYYLKENGNNYLGFTRWYILNGSSSKLGLKYNVDKELYKSFPSGHTCAAASCFTILLLPKIYNLSKKQKNISLIFPFVYTFLVALGRIVAGAHYLSDVLIGATITYISTYLCYFIYLFIKRKKCKN